MEVLVASLIIMVGVTGYVTLQTEYVVADRHLNLRRLAMQLAEEKLNDLSFYEQLIASKSGRTYKGITNNNGGNITAGPRLIPLSNNTGDTHQFEISWQVTDLYYVDSDFDQIADLWVTKGHSLFPKLLPNFSHLKMVVVEVKWLDLDGIVQKIVINSYIPPLPPSNSFHILYRESSANTLP